jgi:hypothetical protein
MPISNGTWPTAASFLVGGYYKKIRDVLFNSQLPQFGSNVLNSPASSARSIDFNTTVNGGSGEMKGIEIAYSQPFKAF